jgi:flagellar basal body-associated protein FliL
VTTTYPGVNRATEGTDFEAAAKKKKRIKWAIIIGLIAAAVIIIIVLCVTLIGKKNEPDNPPTPFEPFGF